MLLWVGAARGDISSTNPAALLIFPKIVVDTANAVDTVIQITNTADVPVNVRCYLVNATPQPLKSSILPPNQVITSQCIETDFTFMLTAKQPIIWKASEGLSFLPLTSMFGPGGQRNAGSIPPSPQDPMVAELKCVEVGFAGDEYPIDSNDLIGQATIETIWPREATDIQSYNAFGVQSIAGQNNRDNTLVLGQEYNGCPNYLILDHFFDYAPDPAYAGVVQTSLTMIPCSEDFVLQKWPKITVQFLVYNEFEQRFSTSRSTGCFSELTLADIDTRPGNADGNDAYSIFSFPVQGTLTGQTWIRAVQGTSSGNGLLAIAEESHVAPSWRHFGAFVPIQKGTRSQNDVIKLVGASPAAP